MRRKHAKRQVAILLFTFFWMVPTAFGSVVVRDIDMTVPELPTSTDWEGLIFFVNSDSVERVPDFEEFESTAGDFTLLASIAIGQAGLESEFPYGDSQVAFGDSRLDVGDTVGSGDAFVTNMFFLVSPPIGWAPEDTGYMGVEFLLDLDEDPTTADPHYGWIYLEILKDSSVHVLSYAFETQPGIAIEVPETGTLVSGLLGLATLVAIAPIPLRRRPHFGTET